MDGVRRAGLGAWVAFPGDSPAPRGVHQAGVDTQCIEDEGRVRCCFKWVVGATELPVVAAGVTEARSRLDRSELCHQLIALVAEDRLERAHLLRKLLERWRGEEERWVPVPPVRNHTDWRATAAARMALPAR